MSTVWKERKGIAEWTAGFLPPERLFICGKNLAYPERKAQEQYFLQAVI